jgi:prepilin-type N-terminal cleavage/methylation domain-containing protein/prepilin-type processing-associated H-X9-DG protein
MSEQQQNTVHRIEPGGFTLVELLVVISIMSMLMSILLPGLSRAREMGKRIDCLSNLRQLTMAWSFYAMDNEDKFCSPNTLWNDFTGDNYWVADGPDWPTNNVGNTKQAVSSGVLWRYTNETLAVYKCKSDRSDFLRSYSISARMTGGLDSLSRASEKIVFIDAASDWKWINGSFFPISCSNNIPKWLPWGSHHSQQITARHNGGCNMSFADFHCEYWRWKDPRTVRFANQQISEAEASADNSDLKSLFEALK